ncbi:hypothetical protein KKA33_04155 [Patescibacteria group bacterium]|nr:hypothetical protein [Patescibacteria group bacterium]
MSVEDQIGDQIEGQIEDSAEEVVELELSQLINNPVYNKDLKLKGTVGLLGELFCPCFRLGGGEDFVEVWYDLMAVDSGEPWPKVDIEGFENGDEVIVTGQLRENTGSLPSKTFWLKSIEPSSAEAAEVSAEEEKEPVIMTDEESAMMMEKIEEDSTAKENDDNMVQKMMVMIYDYYGDLVDVVKGKTILGLSFAGIESSGRAEAVFENGTYYLRAILYYLPIPKDDSFYEGWIVRKSPFSVISTGKAQLIDDRYVNIYRSAQDLTDHDFYVLTLEPNDGDPAPAAHVLEGLMEKVD